MLVDSPLELSRLIRKGVSRMVVGAHTAANNAKWLAVRAQCGKYPFLAWSLIDKMAPLTECRLLEMMMADALQASMPDFRDILVGLPIWHWLAQQLRLDADAMFRRVPALSIPEIGDLILGFLERPHKSPEGHGPDCYSNP